MILVTHGIVGGAIGAVSGSLPVAIVGGFISHLILDRIPHWDYELKSVSDRVGNVNTTIKEGGVSKIDIAKVATDGLLGLFVPLLLASYLDLSFLLVFLGAGFAILPDFLTFVYFKTHAKMLKGFIWFHIEYLQGGLRLDGRPIFGLFTQSIVWVLAVVCMMSV